MDLGVIGIDRDRAEQMGTRWLLIGDIIGGIIGAAIAIALLVTVFS
jgi:hypothetical protein